jgi:SET domain-containing protein
MGLSVQPNYRFQKRQYAKIDIVKTEKKGFGVRARETLEKDAFVYEYIGDIIGEKAFQKRMRDYFDEGIEHFYFMMLQKDEVRSAAKASLSAEL